MDITVEAVENNLRFAGQYYDDETGLHYNYHRYYDPATGRYLTADPIGLAGGINLFAYVQNNPINRVDPHGLFWSEYYNFLDSSIKLGVHSIIQVGIEGVGSAFYLSEVIEAAYRGNSSNESRRNGSDIKSVLTPLVVTGWNEFNENTTWIEELFVRGVEDSFSETSNCNIGNDLSNGLQRIRTDFSDNSNLWKSKYTDIISDNQMSNSIIRNARYYNSDLGTINRNIITDAFGELNRNYIILRRSIF